MGACASKPLVHGDTPLMLADQEPASTHGAEVGESRSERTVTKMMITTTTPPQEQAKEEGRISTDSFQNKEIIEFTQTNEEEITEITEITEDLAGNAHPIREEVILHEITDEAVMPEDGEEQATIISVVEDGEVAPEETTSPSQATIPQVSSDASLGNSDSEEKVVDSEEIVVVEPVSGENEDQVVWFDKRCK